MTVLRLKMSMRVDGKTPASPTRLVASLVPGVMAYIKVAIPFSEPTPNEKEMWKRNCTVELRGQKMSSDEVNGLLQTIDDPERTNLQRQMILSPTRETS